MGNGTRENGDEGFVALKGSATVEVEIEYHRKSECVSVKNVSGLQITYNNFRYNRDNECAFRYPFMIFFYVQSRAEVSGRTRVYHNQAGPG